MKGRGPVPGGRPLGPLEGGAFFAEGLHPFVEVGFDFAIINKSLVRVRRVVDM